MILIRNDKNTYIYVYIYVYIYAKLCSTQTRRMPHRLWDISQQILDYIRLLQTANMGTVFEPPRELGQVQVFVIFRGKPSRFVGIHFPTLEPTDDELSSIFQSHLSLWGDSPDFF
jgi:hypothetical protein